MSTKPTDSQELKLGPGWTSLSKNLPASQNPPSTTSAPASYVPMSTARITYSKAQLLELYEPHSTATIPPNMSEYPGLTSSEPLVPVNIAPDDTLSHVSALAEAPEPNNPRSRFQHSTPRPGVEAILGRENPNNSHAATSSTIVDVNLSSTTPAKKAAHVSQSNRDFWASSAVLAAAERPATAAASERRPLPLKPRSTSAVRASSPNNHHSDKSTPSQPYWSRGAPRGTADSKANWRGGAAVNSAVASGGTKYPGSSADELSTGSAIATHSASARKSTSDLLGGPQNSTGAGRLGLSRDTALFSRNQKEALKPTNTRDLSALAKGSTRDSVAASYSFHHDRESPHESRIHVNSGIGQKAHHDVDADNERIWYYRDPQGNTQGPFTASQLIQWEKEGYYDSELPVSKHADHGFKPLAIAFGMRKEELPTLDVPPGFGNSASPSKRDSEGASTSMAMRPSREERNRRGTRTVEELAEEVEMLRLQARNKRIGEKATVETADDGRFEREKSFFDADGSVADEANGHHVMNEPLEVDPTDEVGPAEETVETLNESSGQVRKASDMHSVSGNDSKQEQPTKQSRFAALMKQDVGSKDTDDKYREVPDTTDELNNSRVMNHQPQPPQTVSDYATALDNDAMFGEKAMIPPADRGESRLNDSEGAVSWNAMMMKLQQQQHHQHQQQQVPTQQSNHQPPQPQTHRAGSNSTPVVSLSTSDQDLMAIDPAIAHASFARPTLHTSSPVASPRVGGSELPPWLRLSNGMDSANVTQQRDTLQDSSQSVSMYPALHAPRGAHITSHEQAQLQARLQAEARVQAEAHARAEAMRQAQVKAQVQAQVQARQMQAQQQARVVQHASALAQVQTQAQPTTATEVWILKHRLMSLQRSYEVIYHNLAEVTRTSQAAQGALNSSPAGSHEHQRARVVFTQARQAANELSVQLEQIKRAAESTNHLLLKAQAGVSQGQQFSLHSQTSQPLPDSRASLSPHSISHAGIHSPNQVNSTEPVSSNTPLQQVAPDAATTRINGTGIGGIGHVDDDQNKVRRNLSSSYDSVVTSESQGWETVGRKKNMAVPNGEEALATDDGVAEVPSVSKREEKTQNEDSVSLPGSRKATKEALQMKPNAQQLHVQEDGERDTGVDSSKAARTQNEGVPIVAPWSKATAVQVVTNGLSLREIQRQEELRSKAEERSTVIQQEREEAPRASAGRWNSGQPWGSAGDSTKHVNLSFKEKMRLEEEQKKKAASKPAREAPAPTHNATPGGNSNKLGTKTGWASLVAKSTKQPPPRRAMGTVVGKRMEDEAPFWDSVSASSLTTPPNSARAARPNFAQAASQTPQVTTARQTAVKPSTVPTTATRRAATHSKQEKNDARDTSPSAESIDISGRISNEFANWCTENVQKITGIKNQETILFQYLVTLKSAAEIRDTLLENLGSNDKTRSFADEFIRRLEFERNSVVADAGTGGAGSRKKGRRHKTAKVDPSLVLGFTSTSSRIMQGTIETPEMK